MSDTIWGALIGTSGTVSVAIIGAMVTIFLARNQKNSDSKPETTLLFGAIVDVKELRILRALFGEKSGRFLNGYKDHNYRNTLAV